MKIKPEHYDELLASISPWVAQLQSHRANLAARQVNDIDKRLRWDALYAAKPSRWVCDTLYPYVDDTHIDTALRSIMRELNV